MALGFGKLFIFIFMLNLVYGLGVSLLLIFFIGS